MKNGILILGEIIVNIVGWLVEYIKKFLEEASNRCKAYTIGAFVLLLFFAGIDRYESILNSKAETEIENTADNVFDPLVHQIESMDQLTQEIVQPFKDMMNEMKPQWIKIALLGTSLFIGGYIDILKTPGESIKDILSEILAEERDEREMWAPFAILMVIDIKEFIGTFF